MKKKTIAFILSALFALSAASVTACGPAGTNNSKIDVQIDEDKSQLYVANLQGGIGYAWLDKVIKRFEEAYKDEVFEEGKKGVQIIPEREYTVNGSYLLLPTDDWEVYFNEAVTYNTYVMKGELLDVSDVVKAPAKTGPNTKESKTIESKLSPNMQAGLTAYNGNYYAIPHYEAYRGVSYDVDVFKDYKLFFAADKDNGNDGFIIDDDDVPSVGPNGIPGDYDDGLPATLEEFKKLCNRMVLVGVTPFIWPGAHAGYTEYIVDAIECSIGGADEASVYYNYNSYDKPVSVVTGFDGDAPQITRQTIDNSTGYLTKQLAGRYYGYDMLDTIVKNIDSYAYSLSNNNSTHSQIAAQEDYIRSDLIGKPIGMIIDGNYWWNEAAPAYQRSLTLGEGAADRHFAWMPMPTAVGEADRAAGAKEPVLFNAMRSFCFVNANIANKPAKVKLAKEFISFCYSDESLQEFTTTTGVAKGLKYELTSAQEKDLNYYAKSCWEMRKKATVVSTLPQNRMIIENEALIGYLHKSNFDHQSYNTAFEGFLAKYSAAKYFMGQWIDAAKWSSDYGKYINN